MTDRTALRSSVFLSVIASMMVMLMGCGDEDPRSSDAGGTTEGQAATEPAGTLLLSETAYQIHIRSCRLDADPDEIEPMLRGTVTGPHEKRLTITVERRTRPGGHIAHSVFVMGEGQQWTAERERVGGRWTTSSLAGEPLAEQVPNEPLIQVRGDSVVADGLFETSKDKYVKGRLSVACL